MEGRRSSWEDEEDRQERLYHEEARTYELGAKSLELARKPSADNHSVVENSMGLLREISDPLSRLQALDGLSEELESERARIIAEL